MSLPRYAEYKESGVPWLGEVPAHWVPLKVKAFTQFCGGGTPSRENLAFWNGDIPWVSPKDMKVERIEGAEERITDEGLSNSSSSLVDSGRLLMVVRSGILKHTIPVAINDVPVALNQDMKALRFKEQSATSEFFLRWVQGLNNALLLAWAKQGATVESIEHNYLAETLVPLPPLSEQSTIAAFLDRETGKIDALIAEQEKLLTLLAEKRQATVSHAVTRGLNPNAPMKDSGVQWLGDVPSHWEVKGVSRSFKAKKGGNAAELTKEYCATIEGEYPVFSGQTENEGVMGFIDRYEFDAADDGWILSTTVGAKAMSVKHLKGRFSLSQNCMVILPVVGDVVTRFFFYHFQPLFSYERRMIPDHMQPSFRMEDLYRYKVAIPPKDEQRAIASFLDSEVEKLDGLRLEVEHAIALLKERRSVLIAAAVTGKIDVREV